MERLIEEIPDIITYRNGEGQSALHALCKSGSPRQSLKVLVHVNPALLRERDNEGRSVLHAAVSGYFANYFELEK